MMCGLWVIDGLLIAYGFVWFWQVEKGKVPPNFNLKDQDGKSVSLSKFKGKPLVLYFYPADETPGCTKQVLFFSVANKKHI